MVVTAVLIVTIARGADRRLVSHQGSSGQAQSEHVRDRAVACRKNLNYFNRVKKKRESIRVRNKLIQKKSNKLCRTRRLQRLESRSETFVKRTSNFSRESSRSPDFIVVEPLASIDETRVKSARGECRVLPSVLTFLSDWEEKEASCEKFGRCDGDGGVGRSSSRLLIDCN